MFCPHNTGNLDALKCVRRELDYSMGDTALNGVVLYAEDNPSDALLMQRAFTKAGLSDQLRIVSDGEEAVAYLQGKGKFADRQKFPSPILLLVDLNMPKKTGFAVIRWLRNKAEFHFLPTVVLTSSEADPDIKKAYRLGANSYLVKPPTLQKISALAENLRSYWMNLNRVPSRSD